MNSVHEPLSLATHDLGDGCLFLTGQVPASLVWDNVLFETVWGLHPEEKHLIMMHGRLVETPRWQQAYGRDYHYTGRTNPAQPVLGELEPLFHWAQAALDERLNGILLNWYEGPEHYIGPHHDSRKNMVRDTPIVTVSFGETRRFRLGREQESEKLVRDFPAANGAVFVMPYQTNLVWKHGVPKSAKYVGRRVSVTFRAFE